MDCLMERHVPWSQILLSFLSPFDQTRCDLTALSVAVECEVIPRLPHNDTHTKIRSSSEILVFAFSLFS